MKLELKHLAPYLPYGLKVKYVGKHKYAELITGRSIYNIDGWNGSMLTTLGYQISFNDYKPILRPLSDLKYKELGYDSIEFAIYNIKNKYANYINYEYCFEWHFDVFGLIEKGLAIDINTLD